jgi:hypothetical protein
MESIQEKIHALVDRTKDPVALENIYNYLNQVVSKSRNDILDDLSEKDLNSLHEAEVQYRRGEGVPHEEVLRLLREWRGK